jgi:hypothetical protein
VCGSLLPTGHALDEIKGMQATLIDNGMPVVVLRAGISENRDMKPPLNLMSTKRPRRVSKKFGSWWASSWD